MSMSATLQKIYKVQHNINKQCSFTFIVKVTPCSTFSWNLLILSHVSQCKLSQVDLHIFHSKWLYYLKCIALSVLSVLFIFFFLLFSSSYVTNFSKSSPPIMYSCCPAGFLIDWIIWNYGTIEAFCICFFFIIL